MIAPADASARIPVAGWVDRLSRNRVAIARAAWAVAVGWAVALFIAGMPVLSGQLRTACTGAECKPWQPTDFVGMSPRFYADWYLGREAAFVLFFIALSSVMIWRVADGRMAAIGAIVFVAFGSAVITDTVGTLIKRGGAVGIAARGLGFTGSGGILIFFLAFPDGRFRPGWTRWLAAGWLVLSAISYVLPADSTWGPFGDAGFLAAIIFACGVIGIQIWRYRTIATPIQRQQTKWVILGFAVAFAGLIVTAVAMPIYAHHYIVHRRIYATVGMTLASAFLLLIPLTLVLAIVRHRLWDVDRLANRAIVYGAVTATILALYIAVVAVAGALLPKGQGTIANALAAVVLCLAFQPIRNGLQRRVNRMMYGERDDPYAVLSRLGRRLGATAEEDAMLTTAVETIAQALRLPYVAISIWQDESLVEAASVGDTPGERLVWPLLSGNELVGELALSPRSPDEPLSPADRDLLDDLARHAGVAVAAARLGADLRQSRERLVMAREEERRRLRRDLHDGLGPQLASQMLILDTARKLMPTDAAAADTLLGDLRVQIQEAVVNVRRVINALRPPVLDDLGLVDAIRDGCRAYAEAGLRIDVISEGDLPVLPAAVEVAAYRIVQEALTNVVRHADATHCSVDIEVAGDRLRIAIVDDGRGLPDQYRAGVGLESMRARSEELNGTWVIEPADGGGTRVRVELPLAGEA